MCLIESNKLRLPSSQTHELGAVLSSPTRLGSARFDSVREWASVFVALIDKKVEKSQLLRPKNHWNQLNI